MKNNGDTIYVHNETPAEKALSKVLMLKQEYQSWIQAMESLHHKVEKFNQSLYAKINNLDVGDGKCFGYCVDYLTRGRENNLRNNNQNYIESISTDPDIGITLSNLKAFNEQESMSNSGYRGSNNFSDYGFYAQHTENINYKHDEKTYQDIEKMFQYIRREFSAVDIYLHFDNNIYYPQGAAHQVVLKKLKDGKIAIFDPNYGSAEMELDHAVVALMTLIAIHYSDAQSLNTDFIKLQVLLDLDRKQNDKQARCTIF